jgi:hypothetical protein
LRSRCLLRSRFRVCRVFGRLQTLLQALDAGFIGVLQFLNLLADLVQIAALRERDGRPRAGERQGAHDDG